MPTATRARTAALDTLCGAAVDLARAAAEAEAGDPALVGEWVSAQADADRVVTHLFASLDRAYAGWRWAVTVARASRAKIITVDEVVLLPGEEALLAPSWLPWSERLRPGDLGVGDLMVTAQDDERLAPAYASADDPEQEGVAFALGLGRVRVLSIDGRDDAVERWYAGAAGPEAPIAVAAPAPCGTCGFWLPIRGDLGQVFGACANEYAPDDGRVVAADHGCGAHSEAVVEAEPVAAAAAPVAEPGPAELPLDEPADAASAGSVDADQPDEPGGRDLNDVEELGHS